VSAAQGHDALVDRVRDELARTGEELSAPSVARILRGDSTPVGSTTVLAVVDRLRRDVHGAGRLEPLLREPGVTDVLVNGAGRVYVDRGSGLELTGITFENDLEVRRLAQRLAASAGRRLDDASPFVDVRLPDGARFHALLAPLARPGTALSLRIPRARAFSLDELAAFKAMNDDCRVLLSDLIACRAAFVVSGGTGSGKTTLLNALLSIVDPSERLVIVEDSSELRPDHPHVVGLEARQANVEGAGEVDLQTLVRQALRMRPDRIVVGEVRGAEIRDLLAALNTGHEGGCGTVHANSATDVPARLEALALTAGLGRDAVHSQMAAALDVCVHVGRGTSGRRVVREVGLFTRASSGLVEVETAVSFTDAGETRLGAGWDRLLGRLGRR
jgi:pilus assembly protein CpaF